MAPASAPTLLQPPGRQDIALSFAHKFAVLLVIILGIVALWAVSSQPTSGMGTDATLGSPMGSGAQQAVKTSRR